MSLKVERLDHLPVIAGTIREMGLIEKIDDLIPPHEDEKVTTGEAIAAMILTFPVCAEPLFGQV